MSSIAVAVIVDIVCIELAQPLAYACAGAVGITLARKFLNQLPQDGTEDLS